MLSRIAELVYWIGRLTERAENLSRLVSAYHYSAMQLGALEDTAGLHDLIAAFGPSDGDDDDDGTFRSAAAWWITSEANPSSAVSCLRTARENARRAREVLSLEVWETLNGAAAALDALAAGGAPYDVVADRIPTHTRAFAGVIDTTAPRDETWEILRAGSMLERATMTLRAVILGARAAEQLPAADPLGVHAWTVTLRACSALDAYRKTDASMPRRDAVVTLLLHSATCPRSVLFSLREAQSVVPFGSEASAAIDWARTCLNAPPGNDLTRATDTLLAACDRIHDAMIGEWRGRWERT